MTCTGVGCVNLEDEEDVDDDWGEVDGIGLGRTASWALPSFKARFEETFGVEGYRGAGGWLGRLFESLFDATASVGLGIGIGADAEGVLGWEDDGAGGGTRVRSVLVGC